MRKILASLGLAMVLALAGVTSVAQVWADEANVCTDSNIPQDLKDAAGCSVPDDKTAMTLAEALINVVLSVVGVLAVGVIVYGAINYSTSLGDTGKVARAKNIIIYGVVGLVVALLAWAIVSFVSASIA